MKAFSILFIFTTLALGADVPAGKTLPPVEKEAAVEAPPTTTLTDPVEVFQKAFWRRPAADDRIRHAERQEWKDDTGVSLWRWFIVVKPSPELVKYLRETNPFNLVATNAANPVKDAPKWFTFSSGAVDVLRASQGGMQLVFHEKEGLLYATDSGGGFYPGKVMEADPSPVAPATSRRPLKLPPEK